MVGASIRNIYLLTNNSRRLNCLELHQNAMPRPRSPQSDHDFLAREIAALTQGQSRSWAHIGYLLDRIDQTDYWRNEAKSPPNG